MAFQALSSASTCTPFTHHSTLLLHLLSSFSLSSSPKLLSLATFSFLLLALWFLVALITWTHPGGPAWGKNSLLSKPTSLPPIPGPRGLPFFGSLLTFAGPRGTCAHRLLASLASLHKARSLMALSLGSTRVVICSEPSVAREILCNSAFAERPLTQSARQLLFGRAIGFSPRGNHWRNLRRLSASHLFSPRRLAAQEHMRQKDCASMLDAIAEKLPRSCLQEVRPYLQHAALNSIMATVFGKRYAFAELDARGGEAYGVQRMVREGFELLGAFNMADHLPPAFESIDPLNIRQRCEALVPKVFAFVQGIIDEHRRRNGTSPSYSEQQMRDEGDFVDVLLALQQEEKLSDSDMVSILWEMIFRGTDTMAILTEWILAELVLNPHIQVKLHAEVMATQRDGCELRDVDIARMPYLQAVVKEALRMHPPGPLLSWARLAVHDTVVGGHKVPAGTTAMVNMWAITHDRRVWAEAERFKPERFVESEGGENVDVRGSDLRLAPFGAGARVCPGKAMAMAMVNLWVARIVQRFHMSEHPLHRVQLSEVLKLSCEMEVPLRACFTPR
ncbi:hypothetical protein GOP47_0029545 [Adiantum capillus-veneris]|nr:hypothetical protein GOP47_0029545 [Adiantum capillus-veneris]